jgi:hypothetical protein
MHQRFGALEAIERDLPRAVLEGIEGLVRDRARAGTLRRLRLRDRCRRLRVCERRDQV